MNSDYTTFRLEVQEAWAKQPKPRDLRLGQVYFNMLREVRPDIAEAIRGTLRDPFHKENIPDATEECVVNMWYEGAHESWSLEECPNCGEAGWVSNIGTCDKCEGEQK